MVSRFSPHDLVLFFPTVALIVGCNVSSEDFQRAGEEPSGVGGSLLDPSDNVGGTVGSAGGSTSGGGGVAEHPSVGSGGMDGTNADGTGGAGIINGSTEEITLRTSLTHDYLSITGAGLSATGQSAGASETIEMEDQNGGDLVHGDEVVLRNSTGNALFVDPETYSLSWIDEGGTVFQLVREAGGGAVQSGDQVGLSWGSQPNFLKALDGGGGEVVGDAPWMQEWETFIINRLAFPAKGFQTIAFLKSIVGQKIVSGQHNDQKDGTDEKHYTERVHEITGKYPALYGADFLFHGSSELRWDITYEAERQWNAGAIVNLMWHACPPNQGESCNWDGGLLSHLSDEQWSDLITDGGSLNGIWKGRMDQVAVFLTYLRDKGVEVLFRPLHEQNQGAFWWGGRTGDEGTRALFRLTHDYFTHEKGLDNLIWTWDVQDLDTGYAGYNPGPQYFEIAALDVYSDAYSNSAYYDALVSQAGDKLVAIGECFGLPPEWVLENQSQYVFFMNWAYGLEVDWNGNPTNSIPFIQEVYENPRVITLDEMPGWD